MVEVRNAGWCPECEKSIAKKVENMKASMAKIGAMLAIVRTGERLQDVDMTHVGLMLTDIGILISDARARDRLGLGVMQIGEVIQDVTLLLTHFVLGVRPPSDESGKGNSTVAVPGLLLALFAMVRADLRDAKVEEKGLVRIGLGLGNVGLVIGGVKEVAVADVMRERYDSV